MCRNVNQVRRSRWADRAHGIIWIALVALGRTVWCSDPDAVGISTQDAFVRVSPRDARYFELSNGEPYIPIGLNLIAPPGQDQWPVMQGWMRTLAAQQGNFIRVWLSQAYFDVEHERSGIYDESKAQRLDLLLETARDYGIRVKLCLEHFRHLGDGRQAWAAKALHHVDHGGTATNMADFFNGQASRDRFRQKLAWLGARIGSRPEIFGWELWNEVNTVQAGDVLAWTRVMLPELRRHFPRNLALQSLGSFDGDWAMQAYRELATLPGNDAAQVHRYLDLGASYEVCHGPMDVLVSDAVETLRGWLPGRPVLLAEGGAVEPKHSGPFKYYERDREGTLLHDVLFAAFFSGAAGPGHIWHWDAYVDRMNLWSQFHRFAQVVRNLNPAAEGFEPRRQSVAPLRVYGLVGRQIALLWCRDGRATWETELAAGQPAPRLQAFELDVSGWFADHRLIQRVKTYDPWRDRWENLPWDPKKPTIALPDFRRSLVVRLEL